MDFGFQYLILRHMHEALTEIRHAMAELRRTMEGQRRDRRRLNAGGKPGSMDEAPMPPRGKRPLTRSQPPDPVGRKP